MASPVSLTSLEGSLEPLAQWYKLFWHSKAGAQRHRSTQLPLALTVWQRALGTVAYRWQPVHVPDNVTLRQCQRFDQGVCQTVAARMKSCQCLHGAAADSELQQLISGLICTDWFRLL